MQKYFVSAVVYTAWGLVAGLLYRTLTHGQQEWQFTQLNVAHTHLLVLGTIMSLVFLVLERLFALREGAFHRGFWSSYHAGVVLSAVMMHVNGIMQLNGVDTMAGMRAGISGVGHILLTIGFALFFLNLRSRLRAGDRAQPEPPRLSAS